ERLSAGARKVLDPSTPAAMRQLAARGIAPGIKPNEALTIVALLSEGPDDSVAASARATLGALPAPFLSGALAGDLQPGVLAIVAGLYARDLGTMERLLTHPSVTPQIVGLVAGLANEAVAELVATNEQRLLANPEIIEKLYMNRNAR